jgi:hypothetical protein
LYSSGQHRVAVLAGVDLPEERLDDCLVARADGVSVFCADLSCPATVRETCVRIGPRGAGGGSLASRTRPARNELGDAPRSTGVDVVTADVAGIRHQRLRSGCDALDHLVGPAGAPGSRPNASASVVAMTTCEAGSSLEVNNHPGPPSLISHQHRLQKRATTRQHAFSGCERIATTKVSGVPRPTSARRVSSSARIHFGRAVSSAVRREPGCPAVNPTEYPRLPTTTPFLAPNKTTWFLD